MIHPTAIVHADAEIGANVTIGPFAVIGERVRIGDGTTVGTHAVIDPYTEIGRDCRVFQFAAIGGVPQSVKFQGEETVVRIGDGCTLREFVTVHRGTAFGGGVTEIGEGCFLMAYTHVAHDCHIGRRVIMANNTTLAGHIEIGDDATVGGLVAVHQFVRIGDYAFIGGKSAVVKDIPPFVIAAGDRATLHGLNRVGLQRHGFSPETVAALKKAYRIVFRFGLTLKEALARVEAEVPSTPEVARFIAFLKSSQRGITR
ncbi:MAG: acyl-ACP--UDP-N-acetylglucosamine O-acyltransferase [Desulfobacterales bacterium]|jgi:UDP-N-acetylglucosamine acyltransferase|nr:acyl-ACP--UDP-N-acetylglucosamine O-acyltransferase [Desulfobacteraceae bacterium]MDD3992658.1 acyl-ACP--UDP-N-acetylglucosamine O-acyltransferase [Desulfobacteraceae bacterium]MDY0312799.1 acyl-ACP--UDP-N-acetylglucosamine O-acyltransferase [Desulfobacterales bacterium]